MPIESRPGTGGLPPASRPLAAGLSPPSSRSAATNRASSRWNGNSATGRRCKDLYKALLKQAGGPDDPAAQAAVLAAAEQTVLAELARSACLANGGLTKLNLEMAIRDENLAARTRKRLGFDKPVSSKRTGPTLDDIKARYSAPATTATGETAK
jgi:hypothetical protein